jgi:hypothetical protein
MLCLQAREYVMKNQEQAQVRVPKILTRSFPEILTTCR